MGHVRVGDGEHLFLKGKATMKKQPTLRRSANLNLLCAAAFVSVVLNMTLPGNARGASEHANQTRATMPLPLGIRASGQAAAGGLHAGTVARVNGVDIPEAQLDDVLSASRQPDTPQVRQAVRQDLIARELLRQNAEKQRYGTKPEVQAAMNTAKVNAETQLYVKDSIHPEPVTDAQVRARYDEIVASVV
jgi:hypothetical protein